MWVHAFRMDDIERGIIVWKLIRSLYVKRYKYKVYTHKKFAILLIKILFLQDFGIDFNALKILKVQKTLIPLNWFDLARKTINLRILVICNVGLPCSTESCSIKIY